MEDDTIEIWYLIGNLSVGGAERTLIDLVNTLDSERFAITVWTIEDSNPLAKGLRDSVKFRSLNARGKSDMRAPLRFILAVINQKPDIIQSFLYFDNALAVLSSIFIPKTSVITGVRAVPNNPSPVRSVVRRFIHSRADHIVSNSNAGVDYITSYSVSPDTVSVIRNGRNISHYRNGTTNTNLNRELGLAGDGPVIGTVGRLIERKGHYDLLDAWPTVLESHPDAHLLLVGDGPEREGLEKRVRELSCTDSVIFAGQRDDVPDLLDTMDVFVFPSHYEGLPGALIEAMIAGLPIIATPVDGNAELIDDGETGLFVPPQDSDAIAERLTEMLSDPELQERLGTAASEYAREEFAIERMVSEFEELYQEL